MSLKHTSLSDIKSIHATLKATFQSGITKDLAFRKQQLLQLARMLQENDELIYAAVHEDLQKPRQEAAIQEMTPLVRGAVRAAQNLDEWAKPDEPPVEEWKKPLSPRILKVPKGVALVIAPWNYPIILCLQPLIGAIAAGCPAVIKPSEIAPHIAQVLADLFPKYLDPTAYAVLNGGVTETTAILELPWDHIFYTGNGKVGRIIAQAAAKHLTPITLELGGQSPVVIDKTANIKLAAKRVLYGKLQNAGQLCVSPNHVFVLREAQEEFIAAAKVAYKELWPSGSSLQHDGTFARIVSPPHFKRISAYLDQTKGQIAFGGKTIGERDFEMTVIKDVEFGDSLLTEEIFGPLLAVVPVDSMDQAINWINAHGHPLSMYVFTEDEAVKNKFIKMTNSGSLIFNDTTFQLAVWELPFGGHGGSGFGYQHGIFTFNMFTHLRSSMDVPMAAEPAIGFRYPPYSDQARAMAEAGVRIPIPTLETLKDSPPA